MAEVSELENKTAEYFSNANEGRDFSIYTRLMDSALEAKAHSLFPFFGDVPSGAVIVDAGSGTGTLAELVASEFRGTQVYALDISHELREMAEENRAQIKLVFGDASEQNFPDNSVDVKYFSTSGHEIESFGGQGKMNEALESTFQELKPGGIIVIRDFAKPERTDPILMAILSKAGVDDVDKVIVDGVLNYNLLSTRALFQRFFEEFKNKQGFSYEIVTIDGQEYIKLSPEWAHEFYLRKDYTANWRQEIREKYTYWSPSQAKKALEKAGFVDVEVIPDPSSYILENRLKGKVALFDIDEKGELVEIPFPPTHMIVKGRKPLATVADVSEQPVLEFKKAVDYQKLKETISFDKEKGIVTIGEQAFSILKDQEVVSGSKKVIYWLEGQPPRVLKVVRQDGLNDHAIFKAMYQSIVREDILDEFKIPHVRVLETDPQGPPYRFFVQEAIPQGSVCAVDLIHNQALTETDISQMASYINQFELGKKWQLDTNPFNWYRVKISDTETQMVYVDGKVYRYDENWEFRRVGLLQWLDPRYTEGLKNHSATIPKAKEYSELQSNWEARDDQYCQWWKRYLNSFIQP
jgi:ubiquinone/menaquinone biosynthesis C-methylase UbiE